MSRGYVNKLLSSLIFVEVAGFEPASSGDRLRLLRAEPVGRSRLRAPTGGGPISQPGLDFPQRPPDGTIVVSLLSDALPSTAGDPRRTAA